MTFNIIDIAKERTLEDVLFILDVIRKDRYFLNKHFQNSICNYFLEDYAGNFLKDSLGIPRAKEITRYIQQAYDEMKGTKYMKLMYGYISELEKADKLAAFKQQLCENMQSTLDTNISSNFKHSKEWQTTVWKRAFSLFVYYVCSNPEQQIKGIFEIWNALFPDNKIFRKRQQNISHRDEKYSSDPFESENQKEPCVSQDQRGKSESEKFTSEQSHQFNQLNELFFGGEFNKKCCLSADNANQIKSDDQPYNQLGKLKYPLIQGSYIETDNQNNNKLTDQLDNYCSEINSSEGQGISIPNIELIDEVQIDQLIGYQDASQVIQNLPQYNSEEYDHQQQQNQQIQVFYEQDCQIQQQSQHEQSNQFYSDDQFVSQEQEYFSSQPQNIEDQENSSYPSQPLHNLMRVSSNQFFPSQYQNNQYLEIDVELEALERVQQFYNNNSLENYNYFMDSLKKSYEAY